MKSTVFLKPLEFNLEAMGERWHQGDKIKGTLKVKNHGGDRCELPFLKVVLMEGLYKKIKARDAKAWVAVQEQILAENLSITQQEEEFAFEFKLAENAQITDKNGSLYLAFFDKDEAHPAGHIELVIEPKPVIKNILQVIENFLRFKVKEIKNTKGKIEVKLIPPASRELSNVDSLIMTFAEVEKRLQLTYLFHLRSIDAGALTMTTVKKTKEFEQDFTAKQYLIYGDSLNQDFILESMNAVLTDVRPKLL